MKIAVLGNCKAKGIASSLKAFVSGAERVTLIPIGSQADDKTIAEADYVFAQPHAPTAQLLANSKRPTVFPYLDFIGFHPDCHVRYPTALKTPQIKRARAVIHAELTAS